jgi:hypothetical protein
MDAIDESLVLFPVVLVCFGPFFPCSCIYPLYFSFTFSSIKDSRESPPVVFKNKEEFHEIDQINGWPNSYNDWRDSCMFFTVFTISRINEIG